MNSNIKKRQAFCVVQFTQLPFEGIDDYVCVPSTWLINCRMSDQMVDVAYPTNEDPFDTRDRVKREESYNDKWKCHKAIIHYETDTYRHAEYWIATEKDYKFFVEEESQIIVKLSSNQLLLPRMTIKRPALLEPKEELDEKRLKLDEATQSSSAIAKGNMSIERQLQPQCTEQNEHVRCSSIFLADINTEMFNNYEGEDIQNVFQPVLDKRSSHLQLFSNTTMSVAKPPTSAEQTTETNQNHIQDDENLLSNFQRLVTEALSDDIVPNNKPTNHIPNSLKMSVNLYKHNNINKVRSRHDNATVDLKTVNDIRFAPETIYQQHNFIHQLDEQKSSSIQEGTFSYPQEVSKNEPTILTRIQNSQRQTPIYSTDNHRQLIKQPMKANGKEGTMIVKTRPQYHALYSDAWSDCGMSMDEAFSETTNYDHSAANIVSGSSSADKSTTNQKSTSQNCETHSQIVLQQQMMDSFVDLFKKMHSTLRNAYDMYKNLQSAIRETAEPYRKLLGIAEKFYALKTQTSVPFSSSNETARVSQATEERHSESNHVGDKATKQKHNNSCSGILSS